MSKKASTAGEDMLSPEMQAKMQTAKKLQDELNAKLAQFGQIASAKNQSSAKEYDDLEKELLDLKKYAASVKNENDPKLNDMINAMNKKMEKMAKTALEEQIKAAKNYQTLIGDITVIINKLLALIESFNVPQHEKDGMKSTFMSFKSMADEKSKEVTKFMNEIAEMRKQMETTKPPQLAKQNLTAVIDRLVKNIRETKKAVASGSPSGGSVLIVPVQKTPSKSSKK